jgi:TolB-like protein/Tfp pilus assembly protein PilF
MAGVKDSARVCETCGSPIETTASGDLGCMMCLLDAALDCDAEGEVELAPALDQLGTYTIEHHTDGSEWELGHGAMGVTYRAVDRLLDRPVALKIINTERGSHSAEARQRFMREARTAAALRHPNVATVYQFGIREETGQFFYAMELVDGETLEERVRRLGPLDLLTTIDIALQVTAALEAAEQRGLVHRDLKPGNLMLVEAGDNNGEKVGRALRARRERTAQRAVPSVKVIDFGVAKAVAEKTNAMALTHGGFVGTPAFASPEQFTNAPVDVRSDIYSLGATLWFLLTGHMLFSGRTIEEIQEARQSKPLPIEQLKAARVPQRFVSLLMSMLAIEPASRPAGARELTQKLQAIRASITGRGKTAGRLSLAAAIVVLATIVALREFHSAATKTTTSAIPEKSVAVLPFENLSSDPNNAYLADGIQEEILTRLASIADLKVISRNSTQRYHSRPANLMDIAKQLGVANILEGSIQKAGDQVRVNVQLINARTDSHLWAEIYDQKLTDVLAVESDIAKRVANSLRAKLTGREAQALAVKPINSPEAYDAYLRGLAFEPRGDYSRDAIWQAVASFKRAVQLDPNFAIAWARLARSDARLYLNDDTTAARRDAAKRALENAQKLEPNSAETLLALGYYQYHVLREYGAAKAAFGRVSKLLPNSSEVSQALALIARREGHWDQSITYFEQALALDPLDLELLMDAAENYGFVRQFPHALHLYDRVLDIVPNDPSQLASKAVMYQAEGNLEQAAKLLSEITVQTPYEFLFVAKITQLRLERNYAEAIRLLQARQAQFQFGNEYDKTLDQVVLALMQRLGGDMAGAKLAAEQARNTLEQLYRDQLNSIFIPASLSQAHAVLGERNSALTVAQRAVMLLPSAKDSVSGPALEENLALIQTMFGENSRAISTLTRLLQTPYQGLFYGIPVTPALLRLDPIWDPLRGDPDFQKLCEEHIDKSIAVLPFENLSRDADNAYFAEGIQKEILTRLAKIADLKVISRASTERYQNKPRNLTEIAKQLGVANILEGSVQKAADQVRVNVQLINAQTDSHLWAETYDRKLTHIFGVESEVAKRIAESLQAKLTGREEQALAVKPTNNPDAYDAYLRGLAYSLRAFSNTPVNAFGAQKYLKEAVRLDPKFALAWALLSYVEASGYLALTLQPTVSLREEARQAAETALTLQPNLGEAVLAKGYYYYACLKDYDTAMHYFEQARPLLPNSSRLPESLAYITRRCGQWDRSEAYFNEAERLDPRNADILFQHAGSYVALRRFPEALRKLDQVLNITPDDMDTLAVKAVIAQAQGDLPRAAAVLAPLHPAADNPVTLRTQIYQAILERRPAPVIARLKEILNGPDPALGYVNGELRFWLGWAQEVGGYHAAAQESWREARSELESFLAGQPQNFNLIADLALTNMGLGDKAAAFALSKQAMDVVPVEKDPLNGPGLVEIFARVAANMGESERAIAALRKLLSIPYEGPFDIRGQSLTPALLRLDPMFDPLRGNPLFQELCAEKQPPAAP